MFGLPKSTEFNKKIPKQKFYEKLEITPALKRVFVEQIKAVYWTNKIAATTTNLAVGKYVSEIEVFKVELSSDNLDLSALQLIDKAIPYHIVFALCFNDHNQLVTSYKTNQPPFLKGGCQTESDRGILNINENQKPLCHLAMTSPLKKGSKSFFHTPWLPESDLLLPIKGLDLDTVYENIFRFIAGDALTPKEDKPESLQESIERAELKQKLKKQIERLQKQINKEKSFAIQVELNTKLKALKRQLEELMN